MEFRGSAVAARAAAAVVTGQAAGSSSPCLKMNQLLLNGAAAATAGAAAAMSQPAMPGGAQIKSARLAPEPQFAAAMFHGCSAMRLSLVTLVDSTCTMCGISSGGGTAAAQVSVSPAVRATSWVHWSKTQLISQTHCGSQKAVSALPVAGTRVGSWAQPRSTSLRHLQPKFAALELRRQQWGAR